MGATTFINTAIGSNAKDAFTKATQEARYNYGNSGYTGSIAEKDSFTMIQLPITITCGTALETTNEMTTDEIKAKFEEIIESATEYAEHLIYAADERINDKWGPAGCIEIIKPIVGKPGLYLFFGWAST